MADLYATLGVDRDVDPAELKRAYRALIRECHPDVAGPDGAARAAEVTAAYSVLSDPARRRDYDLTLTDPSHSATGDTDDTADGVDPENLDDLWATESSSTSQEQHEVKREDVPYPGRPPAPPTGHDQDAPVAERYPGQRAPRRALIGAGLFILLGLYYLFVRRPSDDPFQFGELALLGVPLVLGIVVALFAVFTRRDSPLAFSRILGFAIPILIEFMIGESSLPTVRMVGAAALAYTCAATALIPLRHQMVLNSTVPMRNLRNYEIFGSITPTSPDAMRFDRDLLSHLPKIPGLRVLRDDSTTHLYTHMLIVGRQCVCLGVDAAHQWPAAPPLVTAGASNLVISHFLVDPTRQDTFDDGIGSLDAVLERAVGLLTVQEPVLDQPAVISAFTQLLQQHNPGYANTPS